MMTDFYWLEQAISALPLALWVMIGLGVPWALILLRREDWSRRALVGAVAFVSGPALLTVYLFVLGTLGAATETPLLRFDLAYVGSGLLALIGAGLAWRKARTTSPAKITAVPLAFDEKIITGMIGLAWLLSWIVTAYWPFTSYDPLWVYGYQGRLYSTLGVIPQDIGYYPPFVALQYAFLQLPYSDFMDRAARSILPFVYLGSILAAYNLGSLTINRRTGIFLAGLWALYPHVSEWSRIGDLEITLAFSMTLAATFFLRSWQAENALDRRYNALLAGLIYGVSLWTKPTGGALALGVMLAVGLALIVARFDWRGWWPRFEAAAVMGLACLPLGGVWYARNVLLGHNAVDFPPDFWLTQAARSGDMLGWPLLAVALLLIYLLLTARHTLNWPLVIVGVVLVMLAVAPSVSLLNPARIDPPQSRIQGLEWALLAAGSALLAVALLRSARRHLPPDVRPTVAIIGWGLVLALPYFITWFYSYSYHARLSLAVVPLLMLPSAAILARFFSLERVGTWRLPVRLTYGLLIVALALPGTIAVWWNSAAEKDWLWTDRYPTDFERYQVHNPGVMLTVQHIGWWLESNSDPVIIAPGAERLPFFYPLLDIRNDVLPMSLDELEDATHFLYGGPARRAYTWAGLSVEDNAIVRALGRDDLFDQVLRFTDGMVRYELYEVDMTPRRQPQADVNPREDTILFRERIQYMGDSVSTQQLVGNALFVNMRFGVLEPLDNDYLVTLRLVKQSDGQTYHTWTGRIAEGEHGYYATDFWQPGEYVFDQWRRVLESADGIPRGSDYVILLGFYDEASETYLPVTINGEPAGDGVPLNSPFAVG